MTPKTLLRGLSAAAIVAAIGDAAERWSDADFPPRVRATQAIQIRLGYTQPVVEYALDRLFFGLRREVLEATIVAELGSLDVLDGPALGESGPAAFARGVERVAILSSNSTIGVAIVPAVYALCAKCDVVVKDRSDALVQAFFETLVDERPEFRASASARTWSGGDDAGERDVLANADVVVAFGRDATLREIRAGLRADARFVPFAHRASVGYIDPAALALPERDALVDAVATDALLYDGDGCMSLHALFVAGEAARVTQFVADLATAFERVSIEFPAGAIDPQRAASAAAYRNLGAFRAAGGRGAVYAPAGQSATIAFDPPRDQPPPFLPRVLAVFPVDGPADVTAYVRGHRLPIEVLGVATAHRAPEALALALELGATRIARFGRMQAPPAGGRHGGAPRISDFVRWIECE